MNGPLAWWCRNVIALRTLAPLVMLLSLQCTGRSRLPVLMESWRLADGERAFILEKKLFETMLKSPEDFFDEMYKDSISFDRFVDFLESGVFTNFGDSVVSHLEKIRLAAIDKMQKLQVKEAYRPLKSRVVEKLHTIRSRYVQ